MSSPYDLKYEALAPQLDAIVAILCRRHGLQRSESDDFASIVRLRLLENEHAVLRKFQGQSSLRTYLTVVITRFLLDYRIQQWGKWRPSAEAKRQGPLAIQLERLLYRDGRSFEDAVHMLPDHPRAELERLAGLLPHRTPRRFEGEQKLEGMARAEPSAEGELLGKERAAGARAAIGVMRRALGALPAEDRLILRLRFAQGLQIVEIARTLRLAAKPLYRRIEQLLLGLRRALEAAGVDREETLAALGSVWMDENEANVAGASVSTASSGDAGPRSGSDPGPGAR
jgi:RNA polymerase sigma factor for flagellar operon FliA